jgi:hypothetical protein
MHENYDYYGQCRLRQRNKGLFTADQVQDILSMLQLYLRPSYIPYLEPLYREK